MLSAVAVKYVNMSLLFVQGTVKSEMPSQEEHQG